MRANAYCLFARVIDCAECFLATHYLFAEIYQRGDQRLLEKGPDYCSSLLRVSMISSADLKP